VQGHSDKVRILSRKAKAAVVEVAEAITPDPPPTPSADILEAEEPVAVPIAPTADLRPTRSVARTAARRRRRVLGVLVLALAVVWGLTWYAYLPIWAPGVPGALVLAWLVVARLSVRKQQHRRRVAPIASNVNSAGPVAAEDVQPVQPVQLDTIASNADEFLDQLAGEDTAGVLREELEEALASEGSLWDPLPVTLPTYVNKARARRTVRTIELTGISSSGHDETDSTLAREAAESAQESARTDEESAARRKAAGA
jgi:hypothetical protein